MQADPPILVPYGRPGHRACDSGRRVTEIANIAEIAKIATIERWSTNFGNAGDSGNLVNMTQTPSEPRPKSKSLTVETLQFWQLPDPGDFGNLFPLALVSFASLLLELALTRVFSVVLFYHFAFFAISVALLGLGSGGVFAHVGRAWLQRFETRSLAACLCFLTPVCIFAAVEVVLHLPVALDVTGGDYA